MSIILKFKPLEAPRDFDFVDPDTGFKYLEEDKQTLINRITNYRAQNGLPAIDALPIVLENYWCSKPWNRSRCVKREDLHRSLWTTLRGGVTLLVNIFYKKQASLEVAEARAAQCVECPNNIFPDKRGFVKWSDQVAEGSVGDKKTSYHERLGNCKVCTCVLKAKVFYDGEVSFTKEEEEAFKRVNCWQLKLPRE